jgi:hypothetical protein
MIVKAMQVTPVPHGYPLAFYLPLGNHRSIGHLGLQRNRKRERERVADETF